MALLRSVVLLGAAVPSVGSHTQHLHPPVEIEPLPAMPRVHMPHMQPADMSVFISQAEAAISERFNSLEPAIYNKGKQYLVLHLEACNRQKKGIQKQRETYILRKGEKAKETKNLCLSLISSLPCN
jgi:hypothetical protein